MSTELVTIDTINFKVGKISFSLTSTQARQLNEILSKIFEPLQLDSSPSGPFFTQRILFKRPESSDHIRYNNELNSVEITV